MIYKKERGEIYEFHLLALLLKLISQGYKFISKTNRIRKATKKL